MKPEEVRNPTPEQMTAALLEAARAGRWNHWQHIHSSEVVKCLRMSMNLYGMYL
jgi:hypothetical protein